MENNWLNKKLWTYLYAQDYVNNIHIIIFCSSNIYVSFNLCKCNEIMKEIVITT